MAGGVGRVVRGRRISGENRRGSAAGGGSAGPGVAQAAGRGGGGSGSWRARYQQVELASRAITIPSSIQASASRAISISMSSLMRSAKIGKSPEMVGVKSVPERTLPFQVTRTASKKL